MTSTKPFPEPEIDAYVRTVFEDGGKGAHTYDHSRRVLSIAMAIGKKAGADLRVLGAAALLHDIGRTKEKELNISHSVLSGDMCRDLLADLGYTPDEVEQVVMAIRTHRYTEGLEPTSLEGMILSDADKLDAMGAIGIYRAIAQAVVTERGIYGFLKHADEKLLNLHTIMYSDEAKRMAQGRHDLLATFVEHLREELD